MQLMGSASGMVSGGVQGGLFPAAADTDSSQEMLRTPMDLHEPRAGPFISSPALYCH